MTKGRRHGSEVVAALLRLGCTIVRENEQNYWVARANARMQLVRKWFVLPDQEQRIVERLDHCMSDYMAAVRANLAEAELAKQQEAVRLISLKTDGEEIQEP